MVGQFRVSLQDCTLPIVLLFVELFVLSLAPIGGFSWTVSSTDG